MSEVLTPPGPLQTERLPTNGNRVLLRDLLVRLEDGTDVAVPKGFETDFSSVPWFVRWAVDWMKIDIAGVVHDYMYWCPQTGFCRNAADRIWREVAGSGQKRANRIQRWGGWLALRAFGSLAYGKAAKETAAGRGRRCGRDEEREEAEMPDGRLLTGFVKIDGVDDETWPFPDESVSVRRRINAKLSGSGSTTGLGIGSVRWGGECRVEVDAAATLDPDGGIHISGEARLFEGTTENTTDLEDRAQIDFVVPPGKNARRVLVLENREAAGGDRATVAFRLSNSGAD